MPKLIKLAGCDIGASCPAIYRKLAGCPSGDCPAVYQTDDKTIVIGKLSDDPDILERVGEGEVAVEISPELLDEAKSERIEALEAALTAVIQSTRAYLPPDGISAKECISRILAAVDNPQMYQLLVEKAAASDRSRIASLEATVAKAFLRCQALEEALGFYADPQTYHAIAFAADPPCGEFAEDFSDDHGDDFYDRAMPGKRARDVLCHSSPVPGGETSSAQAPHHSTDGEAR